MPKENLFNAVSQVNATEVSQANVRFYQKQNYKETAVTQSSLSSSAFYNYLFLYVEWVSALDMWYAWGSEGNFRESVLFFCYV